MVRALGPELAAKLDPAYPADNPIVTQEAWSGDGLAIVEQIDAVRRSIGLAAEASGSNNWAVSGTLSATGSPLIAGDPHLPPSMPGIWYQVGLHPRRPLRPRRLAAGHARRLHGPEQRRLLDLHQRHGRRPGPLRRAGRGRPLPASKTSGGRWRSCARRSRSRAATQPERARGAHHPPRPDRQRGARRRRGRAARPALADARRADRLRRHVRAARDRLRRRSWSRKLEGHTLAGLEPDLGRPPRLDRLQADRPPAAAQGRLPRPAEARLDAASSSGRGRSPTRSCRRRSTPRAASWSPPTTASSATTIRTTSPASGSTASAPRGSSSCCGPATNTTSRASRRCRPTTSRSPGSRRRAGWAA